MSYKDIEYETISVPNVRDFNILRGLLIEHKLPVIQVKTYQDDDNLEEIVVHTEGDINKIEFVKYLLKKEQQKAQELLDKIKVK